MSILSDLSARDKMLLSVVGAIALILLSYLIVVKPKFDQLSSLNSKLEKEKNALAADQNHLKRVQELERNFEATEVSYSKVKKAIPDKSEIPSAIVEISNIYKDENVDLLKFAPSILIDETDFSTYQIVLGSDQALSVYPVIALIRRIEDHNRYFRVTNFDLKAETPSGAETESSSTEQEEPKLKTAITVKAYTTEKVIPKEDEAGAPQTTKQAPPANTQQKQDG